MRNITQSRNGLSAVVSLLLLGGCATVNPHADYGRTRAIIQETTGVADSFNPEEPAITQEQIEEMLRDGLKLDEAVRIALLNNRDLQAVFMDIGVAKADWVQSGLLSNPTLGLSVLFPEGGGRSNVQAGLAQNIADLWQIPIRKKSSQQALEQTILRVARIVGELAIDTRRTYLQAVADQEASNVAGENVDLLRKSHDTVKAQREAGVASSLDENLARGQLLQAELSARNASLLAVNAKRRLARLLSTDASIDQVELTDPLASVAPEFESEDRLIELARTSRPDLRAALAAAEAARSKIQLERRKLFPDLSIGLFGERLERRAQSGRDIPADFARSSIAAGQPTVPDIQSRAQRRQERRQEIDTKLGPSLSMTLPIFDQNQAQVARAEFLYLQALRSYEGLYLAVAQDIRITVNQARTAAANVDFYHNELLPQAERNLEFSTTSYSAGQTNILTLIEAQRTLLESRRGFIAARLGAAMAQAELERSIGRPLSQIEQKHDPAETTQSKSSVSD